MTAEPPVESNGTDLVPVIGHDTGLAVRHRTVLSGPSLSGPSPPYFPPLTPPSEVPRKLFWQVILEYSVILASYSGVVQIQSPYRSSRHADTAAMQIQPPYRHSRHVVRGRDGEG